MQYDRFPCAGSWKDTADALMAAGQAEGMIPTDRESLTGEEEVIIARQLTHDGYINAGIAVFYLPENYDGLWLDILYVKPEYRRRGIGRVLVSLVRQVAIDAGHDQFGLGTMLHNAPMLALARSAGFAKGAVYFDQPLPEARS
ncbi:MAG: GNAT family N-acetyltransferase [Pseudorhizobium pelagicum]|uniref:GNAT family N-acetyltransferase n=1 Tax=Pseudorhizobium pelagicum TaxID=1509405 RepID=UPI0034602B78